MGVTSVVRRLPLPLRQRIVRAVPTAVWTAARPVLYGQTRGQSRLRSFLRERSSHRFARRFRVPIRVVEHQNREWVAAAVDTYEADSLLRSDANRLTSLLRDGGVPHVLTQDRHFLRRTVAVSGRDRHRVLSLLEGLVDVPTYVAGLSGRHVLHPRLVGRQKLPGDDVLRVFRVRATYDGTYLGGSELGCDLEFWHQTEKDELIESTGQTYPEGTWVTPRPAGSRLVDVLEPAERPSPSPGAVTSPAVDHADHVFDVRFPIDAVYTWVDGSDPAWLRRKANTLARHTGVDVAPHEFAVNDSRFTSHDELRYSMRSLSMYAGWLRHIYLVTDDQVPSWLDTSNSRVTVVSHRELFGDRGCLPTFNSQAIETQLHHIPALSEQFLYLNDDVFFGRPTSPELFFDANGTTKFFLSQAKIGLAAAQASDMPVMSAAKNNRRLMKSMFGTTISNKFKHVPHAHRKSVLAELEQRIPDDFERTASTPFRSADDISVPSALGHYYGYATGRARLGGIGYFYADIAHPDVHRRLAHVLETRGYDVFCLNDHDSTRIDRHRQSEIISSFLSTYFPLPCDFEADPDRGASPVHR